MTDKEKLLYYVIESTSFSVAASIYYLTQSAVSQHIKGIDDSQFRLSSFIFIHQ